MTTLLLSSERTFWIVPPTEAELRHYLGYVAMASYFWFLWGLYQEACAKHVGEYLYIWKYAGTDIQDFTGGVRVHQDANFIIYRVAEIILMKAQAEVMMGNFKEAVTQINRIRNRAGLGNYADIDLKADDADSQLA